MSLRTLKRIAPGVRPPKVPSNVPSGAAAATGFVGAEVFLIVAIARALSMLVAMLSNTATVATMLPSAGVSRMSAEWPEPSSVESWCGGCRVANGLVVLKGWSGWEGERAAASGVGGASPDGFGPWFIGAMGGRASGRSCSHPRRRGGFRSQSRTRAKACEATNAGGIHQIIIHYNSKSINCKSLSPVIGQELSSYERKQWCESTHGGGILSII